jgi:hypothetical protein
MLPTCGVCAVCAGYVLHMPHAVDPTRRGRGMCYVQSLKRDMHIAHTPRSAPPSSEWGLRPAHIAGAR